MEWAPRNKKRPTEVKEQSHERIWWLCPAGKHPQYQQTPNIRVSMKSGCDKCGKERASHQRREAPDGRSVADLFPDLVSEWMSNNTRTPDKTRPGTELVIKWKCRVCGHEWLSTVKNRCNGNGCPGCNRRRQSERLRRPAPGRSLAELAPRIAEEWDYDRNYPLSPWDVSAHSSTQPPHWKCPIADDHRWQALVADRVGSITRPGTGCPFCETSQRPRASSTNNLTLIPDLMAYFASDISNVDPRKLTRSARDVVTWRCPNCLYTWQQSVNQRSQISDPLGCEKCNPRRRSKREVRLESEMRWVFPHENVGDSRLVRVARKQFECDIVLPDIRVIIEYDGRYWHAERTHFDTQKTAALVKAGWTVIRVRETPLDRIQPHDVSIAPDASIKALADTVLMAISDTTGVLSPRMVQYLTAKRAKGEVQARKLIRDALRITQT